jgi:hypothetical protein
MIVDTRMCLPKYFVLGFFTYLLYPYMARACINVATASACDDNPAVDFTSQRMGRTRIEYMLPLEIDGEVHRRKSLYRTTPLHRAS